VSLECRLGCARSRSRIECSAILSDALKHKLLTHQGGVRIPAAERGRGGEVAARGNAFEIRYSREFVLAPVIGGRAPLDVLK